MVCGPDLLSGGDDLLGWEDEAEALIAELDGVGEAGLHGASVPIVGVTSGGVCAKKVNLLIPPLEVLASAQRKNHFDKDKKRIFLSIRCTVILSHPTTLFIVLLRVYY